MLLGLWGGANKLAVLHPLSRDEPTRDSVDFLILTPDDDDL